MGLSTPQGGERKPRPVIPIGPQPAICYAIIDLGTHVEQTQWGEKKNPKVMFMWEYPMLPEFTFDEKVGPQRLNQVQEYNFFSDEKSNIVKGLKSWRYGNNPQAAKPINFATDLKDFLGQSCQLMIEHKNSTKNPGEIICKVMNNGAIILPPSASYGTAKNAITFFDLDNFSWPAFHALYPWVQKKVKMSLEWNTILQRFGAEPQVQQQAQPQQSFAQMGNVNQPVQQQVYQQPVQQMQQPQFVQQQAAPQFQQQAVQQMQQPNQQVNQVVPPQFHSGHNPAMGQSGANTQQFAPQSTGIIVDDGQAPTF